MFNRTIKKNTMRISCLLMMLLANNCLIGNYGYLGAAEEDLGKEVVQGKPISEILWATRERMQILDDDELHRRRQVRTLPEALKSLPGISIQKTSHGQGSPYLRGFTGHQTLLLVDGIRLNNSVFRAGPNQYWNTVDPLSIDHLEIVKGPGGVLYGSDAVGGAVNAVTKGVSRYGDGLQGGGGIFYRYASAEDAHMGRVDGEFSYDGIVGFYGGVSLKDFGDVTGGRDVGLQPHTGYEEYDGDVKLEYFIEEDQKLVFAFQRFQLDNAWRTHKTIHGISWEGTSVGSELKRIYDHERELAYVQYHGTNLDSFCDKLSVSVSLHRQYEERFRLRDGKDPDRLGFQVDTLGLWLRMESNTPFGVLTYGGEYYLDWVDSWKKQYRTDGTVSEGIQGAIADNSRYHLLGLYVQDRIPVVEDQLDLVLGGRYTFARADAGAYQDPESGAGTSLNRHWDHVVGSCELLYHMDREKKYQLFAGVSQGFRTPNLSDLTRSADARTNEYEIASPDLDPEQYLCYEGGFQLNTKTLAGRVSYFYYHIQDMIIRAPTGAVDADGNIAVTKLNAGDGHVQGVELGGSWEFCRPFSMFCNFTWLDGEVDTYPDAGSPESKKEPISRLMPAIANLGLRWDDPGRRYWLEGLVTVAGEANELSTRDMGDSQRIPNRGTPRYTTLGLRAGWRIHRHITLSAAIENLTNEDYRIHGSGLNEPGTNAVLSLDMRF